MTGRSRWRPSAAGRLAILLTLLTVAALGTASSASAAPCVSGGTSWSGTPVDADFTNSANWSNGSPSAACDAVITVGGTYAITLSSGVTVKSLTIGGGTGVQTLTILAASSNTNLTATDGVTVGLHGAITLDCPLAGCSGGPGGAPRINVGAGTLQTAGTITVTAAAGGGGGFTGNVTNTGLVQINGDATHSGGAILNQGPLNIAAGRTLSSAGSACGDTSVSVTNAGSGTINATGTGTLNAVNYVQGAGALTGITPVTLDCGSLAYTGSGAGNVLVTGGVALSGASHPGQALTITAAHSNTNAVATSGFVNGGTITLDCPLGGCTGGSGGAPKLDARASTLTNAGTITVTALASGAGGFAGNVTNSGTIQVNGNAVHTGSSGPSATLLNQGTVALANGVTLESSGSSCGATTVVVTNAAGGQVSSAGSGTLSAVTYNQGAGTTNGNAPVTLSCGTLTYTGSGASTVLVSGGVTLVGDIAAGQTLRITGFVITDALSNAGTITFDQATSSPVLSTGGQTLTNSGTIATAGASEDAAAFTGGGTIDQTGAAGVINIAAGTTFNPGIQELVLHAGRLTGAGTISGSVSNPGGSVAPGSPGPGTLTVSGTYVQGAGGALEIAVDGTGAGAASKLAVGGTVALQGTLRLVPGATYAASAGLGDSVTVLSYTDVIGGGFATTTTAAPLAGGRVFSATHDAQAKHVNAVVVPGPPVVVPPAPPSPTGSTPPPGADTSAPSVTGVRLAASRFRASAGTTLTLNASRAAAVTVVISQAKRGRKVGKRCVLKAKKGKACTLTVKQATLKLTAVQGTNRLVFRAPKLKPGSYTAVATALATAGPASKPVKFSFTITKAKKTAKKR